MEATGGVGGYSLPSSSVRSSKKLMRITMREPETPMKKSQVMTVITLCAKGITGKL